MSILETLHLGIETRNRFRDLGKKGLHYFSVLKLLFVDSVWRFKLQSLAILVTGFLGVSTQVAVIGQTIYYLRLLEKGEKLAAYGHSFDPKSSLFVFVLFAVGVFISLLVSSWLVYFSRKKGNNLRRKYEEFCSRRALLSFAKSLRFSTDGEAFCTDRIVLRSVRRDANFCGRTVQKLVEAIIPCITFVVAIGVLFYTNVWLTVFILGVMVLSLSLQYRINIRGMNMSVLMETTIGQATVEKREIISRLGGLSVLPLDDGGWIERHFACGGTKKNLDAAESRRMATEKSKLISDLLLAVVLCLILLTIGVHTFVNHKGWTSLVVYLFSLRFCLVNYRTIMSKITAVNRFYPQFSRYFEFVTKSVSADTPVDDRGKVLTLCRDSKAINGSLKEFRLSTDHCIGLISPVKLNRYTVSFLTDCLMWESPDASASALSSMGFVTSNYGCLPASIQQSLGLPKGYNWEDIEKDLDDDGFLNMLKAQVPENLEEACTPELWRTIKPNLRFVLGLLAVSREDHQWVLLEGDSLRSLPPETQRKLLRLLTNRIKVIVYHKDISQAGEYSHDAIAVIGSTQCNIVGLGKQEWFLVHEKDIQKEIGDKHAVIPGTNIGELELELEYEEEDM